MTAPQLTFFAIISVLTVVGTAVLYPGVKAHAKDPAGSALASLMTSALFATPVALVVAAIVNALST